jgi:acyl-CoA reductase-like NAD-dependent aldehyde dehydrogenase
MATTLPVRNPYNGEVVNTAPLMTRDDLEAAIGRSAAAFEELRRVPSYKRASLLRALAGGLEAESEALAHSIVREAGKPITQARAEVQRAIATLTGSAEEATRIGGETLPLDTAPAGNGKIGVTRRFPVGPVAAISPFNFPLNLGLHKVGPALAAGATVLWKPPLQAPGAAMLFAEMFARIAAPHDFPVDALQVVVCEDSVAENLVTDMRIKVLSFTGSARVGWQLRAKAGSKMVTLELGGNAAVIVGPDADLSHAAKRCAEGGYVYAGQVCIAVQRVIVHESVLAEFTNLLLPFVKALKVGDPADADTQVGPMISAKEAERVATWIQEAVAGGAKLLTGGLRKDLFIQPALLTNVDPAMKIVSEEVFGPVVTLQSYSKWCDALAMVNDSVYGLQAGIFTSDIARILQAFETIEAGAIIVNDIPTFRIDTMPYGGVKQSGLGREGMRYAIEAMTEERLLVLPASG